MGLEAFANGIAFPVGVDLAGMKTGLSGAQGELDKTESRFSKLGGTLKQHGIAIGAAMTAMVMKGGGSMTWAISAGLLIALSIGVVNGFVIAFVEIPPLFATLATNLLVFGLARIFIVGSTYIVYVPDSAKGFLSLGGAIEGGGDSEVI